MRSANLCSRRVGSEDFAGALDSRIKGVADGFTNNSRPGDVLMGDGQAGVDALNTVRGLFQRSSKDADLVAALPDAELLTGFSL